MARNESRRHEILFEFRPSGRFVRVTAIDTVTGTEVISVCDATYSQSMMQRLAARKLLYVLRKKLGPDAPQLAPGRRDILA